VTRARIPAALALLLVPASPSPAADAPVVLTHSAAGLSATLTLTGADGGAPRAGEVSLLQLGFAAEGGGPARRLRPAAWGERVFVDPADFRERVRGLIQAGSGGKRSSTY
jgi:hypothetical protein